MSVWRHKKFMYEGQYIECLLLHINKVSGNVEVITDKGNLLMVPLYILKDAFNVMNFGLARKIEWFCQTIDMFDSAWKKGGEDREKRLRAYFDMLFSDNGEYIKEKRYATLLNRRIKELDGYTVSVKKISVSHAVGIVLRREFQINEKIERYIHKARALGLNYEEWAENEEFQRDVRRIVNRDGAIRVPRRLWKWYTSDYKIDVEKNKIIHEINVSAASLLSEKCSNTMAEVLLMDLNTKQGV